MKRIISTIGILSLFLLGGCDYLKNEKTEKLSPEKKLELAEKCSQAGKAYFQDFLRTGLPANNFWDEPEYHYSTKLNTCLIHFRYIEMGSVGMPSSQRNQVVDVYSNRHILHGWFERDPKNHTETLTEDPLHPEVKNYTSQEYFKQKDKLFSE